MKPIDSISFIFLGIGLVLVALTHVAVRTGYLTPAKWPAYLGIGGGLFAFASLMAGSILLEPVSNMLRDAVTNLIWAVLIGGMGFWAGRILQRRSRNR